MMNIFYLDECPGQSARNLVDKHVVKMTLETAQLLSTAHVVLDGAQVAYKATHVNHPCAVWVRQSYEHYDWTFLHLLGLVGEYTRRYGKVHACVAHLKALANAPRNIPRAGWTDPPQAMPPEYRSSSTVLAYRAYYRHGKAHLHAWTHRSPPAWL
jgi:hypothetical protein